MSKTVLRPAVLATPAGSWEEPRRRMDAPTPNPTILCRGCGTPVAMDAFSCPNCGALRPQVAEWRGEGFEWKTRLTWMGAPLVHIAFGVDAAGKLRTARGLLAVGQRAVGGFAFGIIATGFVSCGVVSFGVFSCGIVAVAMLTAIGVNAIAPVAWGVAAIGVYAGGLAPFGWKILSAAP